jgi:hypothetical protein
MKCSCKKTRWHFSTLHNLGANPGDSDGKPAANRRRHDTTLHAFLLLQDVWSASRPSRFDLAKQSPVGPWRSLVNAPSGSLQWRKCLAAKTLLPFLPCQFRSLWDLLTVAQLCSAALTSMSKPYQWLVSVPEKMQRFSFILGSSRNSRYFCPSCGLHQFN